MNIILYLQYLKAALYLSGIQKDLIYFKSLKQLETHIIPDKTSGINIILKVKTIQYYSYVLKKINYYFHACSNTITLIPKEDMWCFSLECPLRLNLYVQIIKYSMYAFLFFFGDYACITFIGKQALHKRNHKIISCYNENTEDLVCGSTGN